MARALLIGGASSLALTPIAATAAESNAAPADAKQAAPAPTVAKPVLPPSPVPVTPASPADAAAPAGEGPSSFVLCDGAPNKPSTLGTVARLVAITAVVGLFLPQREAADPKKRLSGAAGIKACDDALHGKTQASDGGRRIELIFARAIHRMELADWDGAIADIHSVDADQPALVATRDYQQSLGLTARNLEAFALAGKGDLAGAQATALAMAAAAPYDIVVQVRAVPFLQLADGDTAAKDAFYAQLTRLYPAAIKSRAIDLATRSRFQESADDFQSLAKVLVSIPKGKGFGLQAAAACGDRLAGKAADADKLMADARAVADAEVSAGKDPSTMAFMPEYEDFYDILTALDSGQSMRARTLFSAHNHWTNLPVGYVMEVARRLQSVGTAAEQANTPIQTSQQLLSAYRARFVAMLRYAGDNGADRWTVFHIAVSEGDFASFTNNVWRTDKSRYILSGDDPNWAADHISVTRNGSGIPGAYALLTHLAAVAKSRGKTGFMLMPGQNQTYDMFYRIGNADDPNIVPAFLFDADKVIAELGPYFPQNPPAK